MQEKYEEYKKSKEYRKKTIVNIILLLIFCIIVYCSYLFYKKYNNTNIIDKTKYTYELDNNSVLLSNGNKVLNTYKCNGTCKVYKNYFYQGNILLKDDNNIYLYDLANDKKICPNVSDAYFVYSEAGRQIKDVKYIAVKDSFGKWGLIDITGKITIDIAYDNLGFITTNDEISNYSYKYDFIAAKSGSKWGLIGMSNSKGVMDFQYDNIIVSKYNELAVKESGLWYLVDNNNKKLIANGFDSITIFKDYLVVSLTNQAYIINTKGDIISDKIELLTPVDYYNNTGLNAYLDDNNILNVDVLDANKNVNASYLYDKDAQELIKKG